MKNNRNCCHNNYNHLKKIDMRKIVKTGSVKIIILTLLLTMVYNHDVFCTAMHAGVSKINITKGNPDILVNDPLYAKALVLCDGNTRVVIVTMDIINISSSDAKVIGKRIEDEFGISRENIIINASHAHWVQNQLAEDYLERTFTAIKKASGNMVPVLIGAGAGSESRITMNRRIILDSDKEWTIRRATPEPRNEIIKKIADPFDPEIGILRIDKTDGNALAVLYNFACHNYTGVPNRGVTAGFPGFASKIIEENAGNGAVAMFLQGFAGDITPVLYKDVNAPKQEEIHGTLLGISTLDAWRKTPVNENARISIIREELMLPARTCVQKHLDSLEAKREEILGFFRGEGCGALGSGTMLNFETFLPLYIKYMVSPQYPSDYAYRYMQEEKIGINDLEMMDSENLSHINKYLHSIYKMEELIVTEANLAYLRNNEPVGPVKAEITGLKIGDFVLITFPGDIFAKVGLNIKQASPYEFTFVAGYTNGSVGYAPTHDAYSGDAYEVSLSRLAPEWQKIFEDKAMEIIRRL